MVCSQCLYDFIHENFILLAFIYFGVCGLILYLKFFRKRREIIKDLSDSDQKGGRGIG